MEISTDELESLRQRVRKLESRNATWRIWLISALVALLALDAYRLSLMHSGESLRTRNLTIVDDKGEPRAFLNYNGHGTGLVLLSAQGLMQASLTAADTGFTALTLHDRNGVDKILMSTTPDSTSFLIMNGKTRNNFSAFNIITGDSASIHYRNSDSSAFHRWP